MLRLPFLTLARTAALRGRALPIQRASPLCCFSSSLPRLQTTTSHAKDDKLHKASTNDVTAPPAPAGAAPPPSPAAAAAAAAHTVIEGAAEQAHRAEALLMRSLHLQSQRRFRAGLLVTLCVLGAGTYLLWPELRTTVVAQTSDVAGAVLGDEAVMARAAELSKAVVNTMLQDAATIHATQEFLKTILTSPYTQSLLLEALAKGIQDPHTQAEVRRLVDTTVAWLLSDPATQARVQQLVLWVADQPTVRTQVAALLTSALAEESLKAQAQASLAEVFTRLLEDPKMQAEGGVYLWQATKSSITPTWGKKAGGAPGGASKEQTNGSSAPPASTSTQPAQPPSALQQEATALVDAAVQSATEGAASTSQPSPIPSCAGGAAPIAIPLGSHTDTDTTASASSPPALYACPPTPPTSSITISPPDVAVVNVLPEGLQAAAAAAAAAPAQPPPQAPPPPQAAAEQDNQGSRTVLFGNHNQPVDAPAEVRQEPSTAGVAQHRVEAVQEGHRRLPGSSSALSILDTADDALLSSALARSRS